MRGVFGQRDLNAALNRLARWKRGLLCALYAHIAIGAVRLEAVPGDEGNLAGQRRSNRLEEAARITARGLVVDTVADHYRNQSEDAKG